MSKEQLKTVKIDPEVHDKLKALCKQNGYVFQFIVERALIEVMKVDGLFTVKESSNAKTK